MLRRNLKIMKNKNKDRLFVFCLFLCWLLSILRVISVAFGATGIIYMILNGYNSNDKIMYISVSVIILVIGNLFFPLFQDWIKDFLDEMFGDNENEKMF